MIFLCLPLLGGSRHKQIQLSAPRAAASWAAGERQRASEGGEKERRCLRESREICSLHTGGAQRKRNNIKAHIRRP